MQYFYPSALDSPPPQLPACAAPGRDEDETPAQGEDSPA